MSFPRPSIIIWFILLLLGSLELCAKQPASHPHTLRPTPDEMKHTLNEHNRIRRQVYRGNDLVWSPALAASAQKHADYLASHNLFVHSQNGYGENLFASSAPAAIPDAVSSWYLEKKKFNPRTKKCYNGWYECGHYSQIIWRNSARLGCGRSSSRTWKTIVVCQYDPPGNYQGQVPY